MNEVLAVQFALDPEPDYVLIFDAPLPNVPRLPVPTPGSD
jgi:hypothetical protein